MAVYFLDADVLFVHFPKTGGTWVERAASAAKLRIARFPERTSRAFHKHLPRAAYGCPTAVSWTAVRSPDTWYVSWFRYASARDWPNYENLLGHPQTCLADCRAATFEEFIKLCLRLHPGYLSEMYARYTADVDFIGTTENLVNDLTHVLASRIDVPKLDPTPIHVTEGQRPQWPRGLRETLLDSEQGAMKIWETARRGKQSGTRAA